jgi:hypothetical protein
MMFASCLLDGIAISSRVLFAAIVDTQYRNFQTFYVVTRNGFDWLLIVELAFMALVATLVLRKKMTPGAQGLSWGIMLLGGFIALLAILFTVDSYAENSIAYLRGQYSVVEGSVENFHPLPYGKGDYRETFSVGGQDFSYSDSLNGPECFQHSSTHGGPVRQGQYVRIAYSNNCILKLEIDMNSITR